MTEELYKRFLEVGIIHVPVGEYKRLKHKLDTAGEQYDQFWDNSMKVYIFESKRGQLI